MKKTLFTIVLFFSILYYGQGRDLVLKTIEFTQSKDEFKTYTPWQKVSFHIILNIQQKKITLTQGKPKVYEIISYEEMKNSIGEDILGLYCKDSSGGFCKIYIEYTSPMYFRIEYSNLTTNYQVIPAKQY